MGTSELLTNFEFYLQEIKTITEACGVELFLAWFVVLAVI